MVIQLGWPRKALEDSDRSNVGFKTMTADDRKRIAQYLYGDREWTMQAIGKALNVTVGTVSADLKGFSVAEKSARTR